MYHFVYSIKEISTNRLYIGSRSTNIDPKDDILLYMSSSKDKNFKRNQKINKLDYEYTILSLWETRLLSDLEEIRLHTLYDVENNNQYINRRNARINQFTGLDHVVILINNEFIQIKKDEYNPFIHTHVTANKVVVKDKDGNIFQTDKDNPLYINGVYKFISCGMVNVKDMYGNTSRVSINDPLYLSGELVPVMKGIKKSDSHKKKISISVRENNKRSKVIIDNISYYSLRHASQSLNMNRKILTHRCKSIDYPNYVYIEYP